MSITIDFSGSYTLFRISHHLNDPFILDRMRSRLAELLEEGSRYFAIDFSGQEIINSQLLGFAGRAYDRDFLADLPENVDPCGENGEFHSFVYSGPIFKKKINWKKGEIVPRDERFYYCDIL